MSREIVVPRFSVRRPIPQGDMSTGVRPVTAKAIMPRMPLKSLSNGLFLSVVGSPSILMRYLPNSPTRKMSWEPSAALIICAPTEFAIALSIFAPALLNATLRLAYLRKYCHSGQTPAR
jgi:hypothetical protein